jgi:hypothetical protein
MNILKQSTAVDVLIGPFVDSTDGDTEETALTINASDVKLSKNGQTMAGKNDATAAAHDANGMYNCEFDATDTNTVGTLAVYIHVSGALAVRHDFYVVEEAIYDAIFGASATGFDSSGRVDVGEWLGNAVTFGTGGPDVNINAISDDTTAPANLELMYDGTGYTDDTAPASREQVAGIGAASGGSLNFEAQEDNVSSAIKSISFDGVQTSGTFASTEAEDGTYHQIDDTSNNIDIVYGFDIGGSRTATEVSFKGYLNGGNDEVTIQAYDFTGSSWDTLKTISGQSGSSNISEQIALLTKHTGTGADLGKVYIRLECAAQSNPTLFTDQLIVAAVASNATIGYEQGAVWIDTGASNTNTESFVDGTADNPVSTIAAATTIASNLNLKKFRVLPGSSFTLAQTYDGYEFFGEQYTIALGGQNISNTHIMGASLSGTATGTTPIFERCIFDSAVTLPPCVIRKSFFGDTTITCGSAGDYYFNQCIDRATGLATPNFDFGAAVGNTNVNLHDYSGAFEVENMGDSGTDTFVMSGNGRFIGNANCTGGTVTLLGTITDVDNSSNLTVTKTLSLANINTECDTAISDAALATAANLATVDTVVDGIKVVTDALTAAAAANLALSAGQIITGTVSNAVLTPTTTAFAADDITEATADHYNGRIIIWTSGNLAGQATDITDYSLVSSEGNFTVTAMTEAPANNDTFIIV